jgi:hypothetical protein
MGDVGGASAKAVGESLILKDAAARQVKPVEASEITRPRLMYPVKAVNSLLLPF